MNNKVILNNQDEITGIAGQGKVTTRVVMVVENDASTLLLICELLRNMGFYVIEASNGKEALDKLEKGKPEMIFMDINMPVMDGYTTARHIREMPEPYRSIPIIALEADVMQKDYEKCIEAGMNDYISKPFRLVEIQEKIKMPPAA